MKWPAKYVLPENKDGDTRLKRVFAWLPTNIAGVIVWLSTYELLQVYRIKEEKVKIDSEEVIFLPGNWVNITKRCK